MGRGCGSCTPEAAGSSSLRWRQSSDIGHSCSSPPPRDGGCFRSVTGLLGKRLGVLGPDFLFFVRAKVRADRLGGGQQMVSFDSDVTGTDAPSQQLITLDQALKDLELLDERKAYVVELRFFGGLTTGEVADVLKISTETVKRDWRFARNWLLRELSAAG